MPDIAFRPVVRADLSMLHRWLSAPHMARDADPAEQRALIEADLEAGEAARYTKWIGSVDGVALAYLHDCDTALRLQPFHADEPPGTRSMGLFIGPPEALGQGHAAPLIDTFARHLAAQGTPRVIADIVPNNFRSRAAFTRAGFTSQGRRRNGADEPVLLFTRSFLQPQAAPEAVARSATRHTP